MGQTNGKSYSLPYSIILDNYPEELNGKRVYKVTETTTTTQFSFILIPFNSEMRKKKNKRKGISSRKTGQKKKFHLILDLQMEHCTRCTIIVTIQNHKLDH